MNESLKNWNAGGWVRVDFAKKLEQERDEAREAFAIATDQMVVAQCKLRESNKERDEAREDAGELADIASKYLSFLLAITPTKSNENHENETEKVIDALKRWKKT